MNTTVILSNKDILNLPVFKANMLVKYNVWKSQRRTKSELNQLTDLQLKDIGLVRADIPEIAAKIASKLY